MWHEAHLNDYKGQRLITLEVMRLTKGKCVKGENSIEKKEKKNIISRKGLDKMFLQTAMLGVLLSC